MVAAAVAMETPAVTVVVVAMEVAAVAVLEVVAAEEEDVEAAVVAVAAAVVAAVLVPTHAALRVHRKSEVPSLRPTTAHRILCRMQNGLRYWTL